jgi:myosin-5
VWNAHETEGDPRSLVEPHVYETSALAYRGLACEGMNQSILVSGESGAGKTETVKILLSHLASVQARAQHHSSSRTGIIVKRVLDSNPLLEAFGNAKTVRNDNSSRFGKFLQLQFDCEDPEYCGKAIPDCLLAGSKCETYLLEKSRVVSHETATERTYHIFYQLLSAPNEFKARVWDGLVDTDNESFAYVGFTDTHRIEGLSDFERFEQTCNALALIGIKGEVFTVLMRAITIVLQLGNLVFEEDPHDDEKAQIITKQELQKLSNLMQVDEQALLDCFTNRTVKAGGEEYKVPLSAIKAKDSCDAFAKEIYSNMFQWLVRAINDATCAEKNYDRSVRGGQYGLIGLLDIFGFESFETNRFEQLVSTGKCP